MRLFRVLSIWGVLCLVVAGSDRVHAEKQSTRDEVSLADAERFLAFFNRFVDAIVANKDDCAKMAREITSVIDAHQDVVRRANEAKAANKKLPKPTEDKMTARLKEATPAIQRCSGDPEVKKAVSRLDPKHDKK